MSNPVSMRPGGGRVEDLTGIGDLSGLVKPPSQAFSNLFNAYARAVNKAYGRSGALFQRPFGRKEVTSDAYLVTVVTYIHQNSQKHGFVTDFRDWPYSYYAGLLSERPSQLKRDVVIEWFDGAAQFREAHDLWIEEGAVAAVVGEDD